jgi:hypothetical protein
MEKILTTIVGAVFLSGCSSLSQKQDQTPAQGQNGIQSQTETIANSFEMRLKEAQKPFTYLRVDKMKVREGMETDYLEIERQWTEIHEKLRKILIKHSKSIKANEFQFRSNCMVTLFGKEEHCFVDANRKDSNIVFPTQLLIGDST